MTEVTRRGLLAAGAMLGLAPPLSGAPALAQSDFYKPAKLRIGIVPYISSASFFVAKAKGYFDKVGLQVEARSFLDGTLAIPLLVAGELDIANTTSSAALFNTIAKGVNFRVFSDRGQEIPGYGSQAICVSNATYDKGFRGPDGYKLAKGMKIACAVRGSVGHQCHLVGLERAGLAEADVEWQWGLDTPSTVKLMGVGQIDLTILPVPGCFAAEQAGAAKIVGFMEDLLPNMQLACWAAAQSLLGDRHAVAVRFTMAHLQAARDVMAAARVDDPAIRQILADATKLPPALISRAVPRWQAYAVDGAPNVESVLSQAKFWVRQGLLGRVLTSDEVFDTRAAVEAARRLRDENPFI